MTILKKLVFTLLLFYTLNSFCQSTIKEHFISEVLQQSPYSSWTNIYLSDTAQGWNGFHFIDSVSILDAAVKTQIPDSILSQIIINSSKNFSERWGSIQGIKIINPKSRKLIRKKKGTTMYVRETAYISNVVFDNSKTFSMIRMGKICGDNCGDSYVYFFKKVNGKWKLLLKTGRIVV